MYKIGERFYVGNWDNYSVVEIKDILYTNKNEVLYDIKYGNYEWIVRENKLSELIKHRLPGSPYGAHEAGYK
jgi:hypothetical protein